VFGSTLTKWKNVLLNNKYKVFDLIKNLSDMKNWKCNTKAYVYGNFYRMEIIKINSFYSQSL
jgi:hypothetical protein